VNVEGAKFTGAAIDQGAGNGALTVEGVTLEDGAVGAASVQVTGGATMKRLKFSKTEVSAAASILVDMTSDSSYIEVTSDAPASAANVLSISNAAEGQLLIVKNLDAESVKINSDGDDRVTISSMTAQMFVFDGTVWEALSFSEVAGNRRLINVENTDSAMVSGIYSDSRLKANVKTISKALDKLHEIRGVSFDYVGTAAVRARIKSEVSSSLLPKDGTKSIGVLAQEIERVFPELVRTDIQGFKSVQYANLAGFLIQVNKEQETEIKNQGTKIEQQGTKIEQQGVRIEEMETATALMKLAFVILAAATFTILALGIALFCWVKRNLDQKAEGGKQDIMKGPLL
jgi:hypothetical protein